MNKRRILSVAGMSLIALGCFWASVAAADDWPRFRGPDGAAVSDDRGLPAAWSADENVVWKRALPGHGASSPIVVGDKIFVTCYSGYGLNREKPGREEDLVRHLLCLGRADGKLLWQKDLPAVQPEAGFESFLRVHGFASSTPVSDGKSVFVFFGKSGVFAFDMQGEPLWHADVGRGFSGWGTAASPVLYKDLLLVNASLERRSLYALDKKTGKQVWRVKGVNSSWSTPILVKTPAGKTELVVNMHRRIVGFEPQSGEELWSCDTDENQSYAAPSPVAGNGIVYCYGSGPGTLLAIRTGGRGDITKSHVKWLIRGVGSGITSPLLYGEYVYCIGNRGVVSCVKAATGEIAYKRRLGGNAAAYASPTGVDGKIYAVSRQGGATVLAAGPKFQILATNRLKPDDSVFNASPVIHAGQLLLRSNRFLYCIGTKRSQTRRQENPQ